MTREQKGKVLIGELPGLHDLDVCDYPPGYAEEILRGLALRNIAMYEKRAMKHLGITSRPSSTEKAGIENDSGCPRSETSD